MAEKEKANTTILEIAPKQVKWSGGTFIAYETFTKDNKRLDVRFVKEATNKVPDGLAKFYIRVNNDEMNISRKYRYPRLYVQNIIEFVAPPTRDYDDDLPF